MNPFEKHTPSVFVVNTPFQVLCALATIKQLEIDDYKVITQFPQGEIRNSQTKALLKRYNIKYREPLLWKRYIWKYYRYSSLLHHKNRYKRLFIGDQRYIEPYYLGYSCVSDGSSVVFLDDGNVTINYLHGEVAEQMREDYQKYLDTIASRRNLDVGHNYLTIYGDIESPSNLICQLDLNLVVNDSISFSRQTMGVYIVGTNVERFCEPIGISKDVYIKKLGDLMQQLRQQYPDDTIYFIPHGREVLDYGQQLCEKYGCIYQKPQMMIELEILNMPNFPKAIYGYTSTALYTLKKLFPTARVVNILFEPKVATPVYQGRVICSEYYLQNGIELMRISSR